MARGNSADVIIIGAGMSGLTAASQLQRQGVDVIVLEASSSVGGRVHSTVSKLGSRLDLGGQWVGRGHDRLAGLVRKAGGTIYPSFSRGTPAIIQDGRPLSLWSPPVLLALSYIALFDIVTRIKVPRRWVGLTTEKAIASWVPLETTRQLLSLIVSIISTAESDTLSIYTLAKVTAANGGLSKMTRTRGGGQDSLVAESMDAVTSMLARDLSPNIITDMVVTRVSDDGAAAGHVTVQTADGREFLAKKVVTTVPPPMLKGLAFDPPLPADRQALQNNTRMGVVYKAIAVFEEPFWRDGMAVEFLILDDPACGVFDSTAPGGPGHLCFLVTGTAAHRLDALDAAARCDLLLSRLVPHLGKRVLQPVDWQEKVWHQDPHCGGGYLAYPVIGTTEEGRVPMPHEPVGNLHWAGTETASYYAGYIEGAVQAGNRVAEEVIKALA